jgi:hypothetical protein
MAQSQKSGTLFKAELRQHQPDAADFLVPVKLFLTIVT